MDGSNKDKSQNVQPTWRFSLKQIEMKKDIHVADSNTVEIKL